MGIRQGFEEDLPGESFHLSNCLLEGTPVLNGGAQGQKLLPAQRHGDGLAGHFAGPLITGTRGVQLGSIHDRTLADVAQVSQAGAEALILAREGCGGSCRRRVRRWRRKPWGCGLLGPGAADSASRVFRGSCGCGSGSADLAGSQAPPWRLTERTPAGHPIPLLKNYLVFTRINKSDDH